MKTYSLGPQAIDLTGRTFGKWKVVACAGKRGRKLYWSCLCECERAVEVNGDNLKGGKTIQCKWCSSTTHGYSASKEYGIWKGMIRRCEEEDDDAYRHYGGRGISVCARWYCFSDFLADMGKRPAGYSIDRINNNGNYEKGNCRWATDLEQARNRRTTRHVEFRGQIKTVTEWANELGVPQPTVSWRIGHGRDPLGGNV